MVSFAQDVLDNPPAGSLLLVSVVASMGGPARAQVAASCSARMRALSGQYGYQDAYDRAWFFLEEAGWYDRAVPVGVTEVLMLVEVTGSLARARRRSKRSDASERVYPFLAPEDPAYARERAWVWSMLAELEGFDGLDGAVIASMAEQWSLDFRSLLEAVRAVTA